MLLLNLLISFIVCVSAQNHTDVYKLWKAGGFTKSLYLTGTNYGPTNGGCKPYKGDTIYIRRLEDLASYSDPEDQSLFGMYIESKVCAYSTTRNCYYPYGVLGDNVGELYQYVLLYNDWAMELENVPQSTADIELKEILGNLYTKIQTSREKCSSGNYIAPGSMVLIILGASLCVFTCVAKTLGTENCYKGFMSCMEGISEIVECLTCS